MTLKIRCTLISDLNSIGGKDDGNQNSVVLSPDNDKNTSFSIDSASIEDSVLEITKPCFLVIDCFHEGSEGSHPFLFGGMELKSNSRNIESYAIMDDDKNIILNSKNLGDYWQTNQGFKIESEGNEPLGREVYKTVILTPSSKPTSIKHLTLKMLSIRPADSIKVAIYQMKIKCKLPNLRLETKNLEHIHSGEAQEVQEHLQTIEMNSPNRKATEEQLPSAIRALTAMIESVQISIQSNIERTTGDIEKKLYAKDKQIFSGIDDIRKGMDALRSSVENLTFEVRNLRSQNDLKQYHLNLKTELEESFLQERECIQAIVAENHRQVLEELKKQEKLIPPATKVSESINTEESTLHDDSSIS